jgi:TonB family protein
MYLQIKNQQIMKKYIIIILILVSNYLQADFLDAQKNYEEGNYKEAFNEFSILAKMGNTKAQYNLAVMLAKGQGVESNQVEAYGWSLLANESSNPKYLLLTHAIKESFNKEDLLIANTKSNELLNKYGQDVVKLKLSPTSIESGDIQVTASNDSKFDPTINLKLISTLAPNYPRNALIKGQQGWVKIYFDVYPDGTVRNINPVESFPDDVFIKEASKAVALYRFGFEKNGKPMTPTAPRQVQQQIDFRLANSNSRKEIKDDGENSSPYNINPMLDNDKVNTFLKDALKGDEASQYTIALNYETLFSNSHPFKNTIINEWLLKAAQDGVLDAQYKLGQNIFYGKGCKVEKQKGLDWITNAAQLGHKDAQYLTYNLLENNQLENNTKQAAFYWLDQAAHNGSVIAQLKFVKHISKLDNPTKEQIKQSKKYLKNYSRKVSENIDWLHTKGLFEAKIGNINHAKKSFRRAIFLAKKLDWNIDEMENDLKSI